MYENDEMDITGVGMNDVERVRDPNEPLNAEYHTGRDIVWTCTTSASTPRSRRSTTQKCGGRSSMAMDRDFLAERVPRGLWFLRTGVLPPGIARLQRELRGQFRSTRRLRARLWTRRAARTVRDVTLLTSGQGAAPSETLAGGHAHVGGKPRRHRSTIEQEDFGLFLRDIDEGNFADVLARLDRRLPRPAELPRHQAPLGERQQRDGVLQPERRRACWIRRGPRRTKRRASACTRRPSR